MAPISLSCTTCCLRGRGRDEIEETFVHAPQAGFTAWGLAGPLTWTPGLIQWLDCEMTLSRARAVGLIELTEVYGPAMPNTSPEAAELGAYHLGLTAEVCRRLGSDRLVFSGAPRQDGGLANAIHGLRKLAQGVLDITICVEPHFGSQFQTWEDYETIFSEIQAPNVGITVDTGHFHTAGVDTVGFIRHFRDLVRNVHLKDHIGPQSVSIGTGEINLEAIIAALRGIDYEGPLALELEVTDPENLPQYVAESHAHLKALLGEV